MLVGVGKSLRTEKIYSTEIRDGIANILLDFCEHEVPPKSDRRLATRILEYADQHSSTKEGAKRVNHSLRLGSQRGLWFREGGQGG